MPEFHKMTHQTSSLDVWMVLILLLVHSDQAVLSSTSFPGHLLISLDKDRLKRKKTNVCNQLTPLTP